MKTALSKAWNAREETHFRNKKGWPAGPWKMEPDRIEWRYHGTPRFPLLIVRGPSGALCGYVGVPPGHPYHGVSHQHVEAECHDGLTYSASCRPDGHICHHVHVPHDGQLPDVWWLGFDCAHYMDLMPAPEATYKNSILFAAATYRTVKYVRQEVERLAKQLAGTAKGIKP